MGDNAPHKKRGVSLTHAAIVGWGKCLPPLILTNQDLATFLPTDDEWITTRTGMKERRISHVPGIELAITAARRAVACAGMSGKDIELVIYGSCSLRRQHGLHQLHVWTVDRYLDDQNRHRQECAGDRR
jgi:hypothetical protein